MKLNPVLAAKAAESESAIREPVPAGTYEAVLTDVEPRTSQSGNSYWAWTYKITKPEGAHVGRLLWDNTSLLDSAAWKLKQVAEAHGTTPENLDTDELIGSSRVRLVVNLEESTYGKSAGQMVNRVVKVLPATTDEDGDQGQPVADKAAAPASDSTLF